MSVINDAQTNRVCALSITLTSYLCLNTSTIVFYNGCSRVLEKFVRISGVCAHGHQTACSYRGTIY